MVNNNEAAKAHYEAPTVTKIGEFEVVTQHSGKGKRLDAAFAADTLAQDITFS